ncbi:hypothetical protein R3P38DRAFT_3143150 [Favolaschia claudopus]|uniref:Fork-head domain-containing protein n=1 Tax=Favolaschia claudopus TaxID=2862362 RepID=A0AAV9Z4N8_9AGAR
MSNTIADSEPASSASNSDAWCSVGGNSQVPEATPVCYSNRSSLAVAVWRGNMESKCSNLQLDLTTNIKLCAPLTRGLWALLDPEGPTFRKPAIWTWPFLLKLVLLDERLSIQEIIAEFSKRFTWCRGSDWAWKKSIRSCLTRKSCFVSIQRRCAVGRAGKWEWRPES